jgi:putative aldouronate transport system permease protein
MDDKNETGCKAIDNYLGYRIFTVVNYVLMVFLVFIWLYPILFVFAQSLSDGHYILAGEVGLIPKGVTLRAYKAIFENANMVSGYVNTIFYVVFGVIGNVFFIALTAYPLSKKRLVFRNFFSLFIAFTMLFSGGLIPTFMVVRSVGLYNTRLWIIMAEFFGVWYIIMMRTFFQNIPESIDESARIDGCSDFIIMLKIYLPLSKPILATIALFTAVSYWNGYFNALIYLSDSSKYPIQVVLRNFIFTSQGSEMFRKQVQQWNMDENIFSVIRGAEIQSMLKYTSIILTVLPMILLFLPVQKYFIKGVLIGSIKG